MRPRTLDHLRSVIRWVNIRTKSMSVEPLDLDSEFAWAQRDVVDSVIEQYNDRKPVRIIILKARQLGSSTVSAALIFNWLLMFPGCQALEIAHDTETTQSLFEKIQDAWEWWPAKGLLNLKHASQRRLTIEETGSSVRIATAKNVKSGRGRTIQALHCSEMSFWDDPETLMMGLTKTVPSEHGTIIIVECTANGVGNLYWQMWQDAVAGRSDYVPLFFPWWRHPEYQVKHCTLDRNDLDEYEHWLHDELDVSLARIEWRRWSINNEFQGNEEAFQQEMPATPEEAFLRTGRNVFNLDDLRNCYKIKTGARGYLKTKAHGEYEFVRDHTGPLTIFAWPSKDREWGDYFVAGDPSRTNMGDPACAQIINRRTLAQVGVWHGQIDPWNFADEMIKLGRYYNDAMLSAEIEGPGQSTIGALIAKNYPRIWQHRWADKHQGKVATSFGWSTNYNRKNWMMGTVQKLLRDRSITLHDQVTYEQMRDYSVITNSGEMGPSSKDGHDDAVMAFAQAVHCSITEGPVASYRPPAHGQRKPVAPENNDLFGVPPWQAWEGGSEEGLG